MTEGGVTLVILGLGPGIHAINLMLILAKISPFIIDLVREVSLNGVDKNPI